MDLPLPLCLADGGGDWNNVPLRYANQMISLERKCSTATR